jgi:hypothetical protein
MILKSEYPQSQDRENYALSKRKLQKQDRIVVGLVCLPVFDEIDMRLTKINPVG